MHVSSQKPSGFIDLLFRSFNLVCKGDAKAKAPISLRLAGMGRKSKMS